MIEVTGDFWELAPKYETLIVTTNGIVKQNGELVMGAGLAKGFKERFPALPSEIGGWVSKNGNVPGWFQWSGEKEAHDILSMPTKEHYRNPSSLELIYESALEIKKVVVDYQLGPMLSVRPGCGLGRLRWEDVKPVLEKAGWCNGFTIVERP